LRRGWRRAAPERQAQIGRRRETEGVAERAEDAAGLRGGGDQRLGLGVRQEHRDLAGKLGGWL